MANLNLTGTSGDDTLLGGTGNDTLSGGAGNDSLNGGSGNDSLIGGAGNDTLDGGAGNDTILGGDGNDLIKVGAGNDLIDGGLGIDTLDGSSSSTGITVNMSAGTLSGPGTATFTGIEAFFGGSAADSITGSSAAELFMGNSGNDTIISGGGADTIYGGGGNDSITGGSGDSLIYGEAGNDTILGGSGNELIDGGTGSDSIVAGAGNDSINGGDGSDTISGGDGNDIITSSAGADRVTGDAGNDTYVYNASLSGASAQTFDGGTGIDTLEIHVTAAQLTVNVQAEIIAFQSFIANPLNAGKTFQFTALGNLQVKNVEVMTLVIDSPLNSAPVIDSNATTTTLTGSHNAILAGTISATDANGDALTYSTQTGPQHGTLTFTDSNGHYTYAANGYVGSDSFTLSVSDGQGGVTTQVVNVTTTNAGPLVSTAGTDTTLTVAHKASISGAIAATDADGDALTYTVQTGPQHGTVAFTDANGHYVYTAGDYVGADSFTLAVSDGHGGITTQVVNVATTNAGPVVASNGTDTTFTVAHKASIAGAIAATDAEGDALTYAVQTGPQHGTVAFTDSNGHYVYTAGDYVGADSFTLSVSDGHGGVTTQVVNITDTNTGPVVSAGGTTTNLTVAHKASISGAIAATDADGDALAYTVQTGPQHGTVAFTDSNGHYVYTAGDYVGADSFTLSVSDGHGGVTTQFVNITDTNTGPVVSAGGTTTNLTVAHKASIAGAIAATDAEGDALTYAVQTGPQHGTVAFTDSNGHYVYTAGDYVGADSFTLSVSDGHGGVTTQVVNVATTNAGPVVSSNGTTTNLTVAHKASIAGAIAATDADGDALTYTVQTGPQHGTVAFTDANGHYVYTAGDYVGADSFTLAVSDGHGGVTTQVVNVATTNAGPVVSSNGTTTNLTVAHKASIAGAIAATDADGDALTYAVQTGPQHGTVTFTDANGHYVYTAGDYVGADSFTLSVSDGHGGVTTQVVNVTDTNTGPVVSASGTTSALSVLHNQAVSGALVATDANGDALSYSVQTGPQHGTLVFTDANGHYTFTAADYAGTDSFTLQVDDGHGGITTQTVTVGITGTTSVAGASAAQSINLATGAGLSADQAKYTIDLIGSDFNDTLTGDARDNVLSGGAGNDTIAGGDGNDRIDGGVGNDNLSGGNGDDRIDGGDGNDALNGGAGNDTLIGGNGNDGIYGGGGTDLITGDAGNDRIFGDGGNDTIYGGLGNDTLTGGTQNGAGEQGNDTFVWTRNDVLGGSGPAANLDHITDFGAGDKLDFSQLFNGAHPAVISTVVHVTDTAAGTVVSADLGSGFVDVVVLDGVHGVTVDSLDQQHAIIV